MRPVLLHQRSNSTPQLGLVNVSVQEAGIIFSAAQKATARRRRPMSEFSPGPSVLKQTYEQNSPSPVDLRSTAPDRPSHLAHQLSTSSTSSTSTAEPLPASIETGLEELAATQNSTPASSTISSPLKRALTAPASPKRLVPNGMLKAYADGLFLFTQSRLNTTVPTSNMPIDLSLLVPHIAVDDASDTTSELSIEESRRNSRPLLRSRFSDWTTPDTESVAELSELGSLSRFSSRRDSGVYSPDMQAAGMMSPDSFFTEDTPKVRQTTRWTDSLSRASSPTRGYCSSRQPASAASSGPRTRSTSVSDSFSYFAGFDSMSAAAEAATLLPDMDVLQSPYTPSTQPARSKRSSRLVVSSASDTTPFFAAMKNPVEPACAAALTLPVTPQAQMMEVDCRPPSWLVRAIG